MKTFEVKWRGEGVALVKGNDGDEAVAKFQHAVHNPDLAYGESDLVDDIDFDAECEILGVTLACE